MAFPKTMALVKSLNLKVRVAFFMMAACIVAWFSFASAVAMASRQEQPAVVLSFKPNEPIALAKQADLLLATDTADKQSATVRKMAMRSVMFQPLNPRALRILATLAQKSKDSEASRIIYNMAARQTKRNLGVNVWLVEQAAANNDAKKALYFYDIVIRSDPNGQKLLFPQLAQAIRDLRIRAELQLYLRKNVSWFLDFANFVIYYDLNIEKLAQLAILANGFPDQVGYKEVETKLIEKLLISGEHKIMVEFARLAHPKSSRTATSAELIVANLNPRSGPFHWRNADLDNASSNFETNTSNGKVHLVAWAGFATKSVVASKILAFSPGQFLISFNSTSKSDDLQSKAYWTMTCVEGKRRREIWKTFVPKGIDVNTTIQLEIPKACPLQMFELSADGGRNPEGETITISSFAVR